MKMFVLIALMLVGVVGSAQTIYTGTIGTYPVELVMNMYANGVGEGVYAYTKHNTPIKLLARITGKKMVLTEKAGTTLEFPIYSAAAATLTGTWKDASTKKELPITLTKNYELSYGSKEEWKEKELLQDTSFTNTYFKLVLTKKRDEDEASVMGVRLYDKKTQRLVQYMAFASNRAAIYNVEIGDFNFDGHLDFSVFEHSYAGPNTSSIYYLFDPLKKTFFDAHYEGVSLEFDYTSKKIIERNQCCAGERTAVAIYKVVNNKMVMKEHHCYRWDEKKQDHVERPYKECE